MLVAILKLVAVLGLALPAAFPTRSQIRTEQARRLLNSYQQVLRDTEMARFELEVLQGDTNKIKTLRSTEEVLKSRIKTLERSLEPHPAIMPTGPLEPPVKLPVRD